MLQRGLPSGRPLFLCVPGTRVKRTAATALVGRACSAPTTARALRRAAQPRPRNRACDERIVLASRPASPRSRLQRSYEGTGFRRSGAAATAKPHMRRHLRRAASLLAIRGRACSAPTTARAFVRAAQPRRRSPRVRRKHRIGDATRHPAVALAALLRRHGLSQERRSHPFRPRRRDVRSTGLAPGDHRPDDGSTDGDDEKGAPR